MAGAAAGLPAAAGGGPQEPAAVYQARLKWFARPAWHFIHWASNASQARGRMVHEPREGSGGDITRRLPRISRPPNTTRRPGRSFFADAGAKGTWSSPPSITRVRLFDSAVSDWNAVQASARKRDLIQPLGRGRAGQGAAVRRLLLAVAGLGESRRRQGQTRSRGPRAEERGLRHVISRPSPSAGEGDHGQVHPDILWWDTEYSMMPERAKPFFDFVCSMPNVIINSRLGGGVLGDFRTSEAAHPGRRPAGSAAGSQHDHQRLMGLQRRRCPLEIRPGTHPQHLRHRQQGWQLPAEHRARWPTAPFPSPRSTAC